MRRNESFAIEWERFDSEARTVRVVRQLDKCERRFVPTKGKRPGTALVLPSGWEHHQPGARGLVLAEIDGGPVSPQTLSHLIRRLLTEAGVARPAVGWHTFRHTYARDFIIGVRGDFGLLQKSLRHRSIVTTEKLYGHFHEDVAAGLARQRIYPDRALRAV
jgi:integrase